MIDTVMRILRKEAARFREPVVSQVSYRKSPYEVLISCLISLRTKDEVTAPASKRLFKIANTPHKMVKVPLKKIEEAIYPAGFYITKAKRIKDISRVLLSEYEGKVPCELDELLKLHGVGRKTANIVVTLGFHKEGIAVDTHVHRISNRLGLVRTKTPDQSEFALRKVLPKKYWMLYNDLLVTWGQNVCKPVSPFCSQCGLRKYCKRVGVARSR